MTSERSRFTTTEWRAVAQQVILSTCPQCGADLSKLTFETKVCPHCGADLSVDYSEGLSETANDRLPIRSAQDAANRRIDQRVQREQLYKVTHREEWERRERSMMQLKRERDEDNEKRWSKQ